MSATQDENSVNFYKGSTESFKKLKKQIYELKDSENNENTSSSDTALEKLKKKFVEGEITEEEFQKKKELIQD